MQNRLTDAAHFVGRTPMNAAARAIEDNRLVDNEKYLEDIAKHREENPESCGGVVEFTF
jgi:hypothetical protein